MKQRRQSTIAAAAIISHLSEEAVIYSLVNLLLSLLEM